MVLFLYFKIYRFLLPYFYISFYFCLFLVLSYLTFLLSSVRILILTDLCYIYLHHLRVSTDGVRFLLLLFHLY
jgi:hypothetical protein